PLQLSPRLGLAGRAWHLRDRLHALWTPRAHRAALSCAVRGGRALRLSAPAGAAQRASARCRSPVSGALPARELAAGLVVLSGLLPGAGAVGVVSLRAVAHPAARSAPAALAARDHPAQPPSG